MKRSVIVGLVLMVLAAGFGLGAKFLFDTTAVAVGEYYKGIVLLDEDGYRDFKSKLAEGPTDPKFDRITKLEIYASEGYLVDFDVAVGSSVEVFYGEHHGTKYRIPFPFTLLVWLCGISVVLALLIPTLTYEET